jgi:hypothetical protein
MIFNEFIQKTGKYLKSVRILKNYVSFDMVFPNSWVMLKKFPETIEILQNETNEGVVVTSFVCQNEKDFINTLENTMDVLIKTNIDREEKEKLFKSKVKELQNIFEKEKLDSLKSLKFEIEDIVNMIDTKEESDEKNDKGVGVGVETT